MPPSSRRSVSRQRRYQLRQIAAGNCPRCGQPRGAYALCDQCQEKDLEQSRKRKGVQNPRGPYGPRLSR